MEKIWVKANDSKKNLGRVACHEYDTAHVTPENTEGLLDISPCSESSEGYEPRHVAGTPYVYDCIRAGRLDKIPAPSLAEQKALLLAADKKISVALARQEIAEARDKAEVQRAADEALIVIADAQAVKAKAETAKAKAETEKAKARKARAEEKKAKSAASKAEGS